MRLPRASARALGAALAVSACSTAGGSVETVDVGRAGALETLAEGRAVFLEAADPRCGVCHTLRDAGATGTLGPNLDDMRPDLRRVATAVRNGVGVMSAQEHLTEQQIEALAAYVSRAAGSGGLARQR